MNHQINIPMPIINYNRHWYSFPKNRHLWFPLSLPKNKEPPHISHINNHITSISTIHQATPPGPPGAWPLLRSLRRSTARWPPSSPAPPRRRSAALRRRCGACGALAPGARVRAAGAGQGPKGEGNPGFSDKNAGKMLEIWGKRWGGDVHIYTIIRVRVIRRTIMMEKIGSCEVMLQVLWTEGAKESWVDDSSRQWKLRWWYNYGNWTNILGILLQAHQSNDGTFTSHYHAFLYLCCRVTTAVDKMPSSNGVILLPLQRQSAAYLVTYGTHLMDIQAVATSCQAMSSEASLD